MSARGFGRRVEKGRDADKGVFLIVLFVCVPFCVVAGIVVWMAG